MSPTLHSAQTNSAPTTPAKVTPFVAMPVRDLVAAMISGAVTGLVAAGAAILLNRFVFTSILCREGAASDCTQSPLYAVIIAVVISAILGTVALARLRVFRPLLVVISVVIALWAAHFWFFAVEWYWALLIGAVLYGLAYGAFAWIARIRSFIMSLVLTVVLIVALRLLIQA